MMRVHCVLSIAKQNDNRACGRLLLLAILLAGISAAQGQTCPGLLNGQCGGECQTAICRALVGHVKDASQQSQHKESIWHV